jgi:hypothetical protein
MNAVGGWLGAISPGVWALAGEWLAVLLTLAIFSRLLGENILSRLAQHLFVGVAAGYAVGMAWLHVLWPRVQLLLGNPFEHWHIALFVALGLLLLARGVRPTLPIGDAPVSILLGVGAGLALVGTLRGTLGPQAVAAIGGTALPGSRPPWLVVASTALTALATLLTLAAFHFHRRPSGVLGGLDRIVQALGAVGRRLVLLAMGAVLAGAWLAFFAALQGRIGFVYEAIHRLLAAMGPRP